MTPSQTLSTIRVAHIALLDPSYRNGDAYWDGDQTLWEAVLEENGGRHRILFVVARGNAFIAGGIVKRHIEALAATCDPARPIVPQLQSLATRPDPRRHPQIRLNIEPPGV